MRTKKNKNPGVFHFYDVSGRKQFRILFTNLCKNRNKQKIKKIFLKILKIYVTAYARY